MQMCRNIFFYLLICLVIEKRKERRLKKNVSHNCVRNKLPEQWVKKQLLVTVIINQSDNNKGTWLSVRKGSGWYLTFNAQKCN